MKTFKIKDLMVSIATEKDNAANFCYPHTFMCTVHHSIPPPCCKAYSAALSCNDACSRLVSFQIQCPGDTAIQCPGFSCAGGSRLTDFIFHTDVERELVIFQEAELSELKTQLAHLQKQVDIKLQRTPQELDQLETKLGEAINEVRAQKANISKKK